MNAIAITECLNVLYGILILAQIALGLGIVMGLLNVLNIAHGEFIMLGCYCAFVVQKAGLPYILAAPLAAIVCGLIGAIVERVLIRPLRYDPFDTLLATWGLGLFLRESVKLLFGLGYRSVDAPIHGAVQVFGVEYPAYRITLMALSATILIVLTVWYQKAGTGARIRAMVGNPILAEAVGIPIAQLARNTFVAGTVCAGLAGVMIAPLASVEPFMGVTLVINAFFSLVVGGMGTVIGLITGSAVIGGLQSVVATFANPTTAYLLVLILSILFLWRRPRGIFPRS